MTYALFVTHRALPGKRDQLMKVWEKFVKPRAAANPDHLYYTYTFDNNDPDVVRAFQLYPSEAAAKAFMTGDWYKQYLAEVAPLVANPPELAAAEAVWTKGSTFK